LEPSGHFGTHGQETMDDLYNLIALVGTPAKVLYNPPAFLTKQINNNEVIKNWEFDHG